MASSSIVYREDPEGTVGRIFSREELVEKVRAERREDDEKMREYMEYLKRWIKAQPHLAETGKQDEKYLRLVLRGTRYRIDRSKRIIEGWNTTRSLCPEFYDGWDVEEPTNKHLIEIGVNVMLPGYDKHGRRVFIQRLSIADPHKYKYPDVLKVSLMNGDITISDFTFQDEVCGAALISDYSGIGMAHVKQFTPGWAKKINTLFQVFPSMPHVVHLVNMPVVMEKTFVMVRGLMKEKLKRRVFVHTRGHLQRLVEDLGTDVLPEEYGGTNGTIEEHANTMAKKIFDHRDFLLEQTKVRSDESKRIGGPKTFSKIFKMDQLVDVPEPSPKSGEEEAGEAGKKAGKEDEEEDEEGEEEEEEAGETQGQASDSANSAIPPAQKSVAVVN